MASRATTSGTRVRKGGLTGGERRRTTATETRRGPAAVEPRPRPPGPSPEPLFETDLYRLAKPAFGPDELPDRG